MFVYRVNTNYRTNVVNLKAGEHYTEDKLLEFLDEKTIYTFVNIGFLTLINIEEK